MTRRDPVSLLAHAELTSTLLRTRLLRRDAIEQLKRKFVFGKILTVVFSPLHERRASRVDRFKGVGITCCHDCKHLGDQAECHPTGVDGICHFVSNRLVSNGVRIAPTGCVSTTRVPRRLFGAKLTVTISLMAMLAIASTVRRA
jgi:hypothetical protein